MSTGIMVVEDEPVVARQLHEQLQELGYDIRAVASTGDQALSQAKRCRPDVILMDIQIDGAIDGIEAAARIRSELDIPIVFLTAYSEDETLRRARETKPFGYLMKPFSEQELHATIQMVIERHAIETALRESEQRLSLALDAAEMGSWELDAANRRIMPAGQADAIFGFSPEVFSCPLDAFLQQVHEEDRAQVAEAFGRMAAADALCQVEFRRVSPDGTVRWLKVQGRAFLNASDGNRRIIGIVVDDTDRRCAEERLRQAATVFEATYDGIAILDDRLRVISINQGFRDITGFSQEEVQGRPLYLLNPRSHDSKFRRHFSVALRKTGQWRGETAGWKKNGEEFPLMAHVAAVRNARQAVTHYVAVFSDMTAIRKAEDDLKRLAHYDPLTDLPNRLLAMDRLGHAMERNVRGQYCVGLMLVDLDHFKNVNDTLGHSAGDDLLRIVANRIRASVRSEDTVARLGGDEFVVIVEEAGGIDALADLADKIISALTHPIRVAGTELSITASIGIGFYPEDARIRENLIRAADTAMYAAKELGRNRYAFYTKEMTVNAVTYMALSQDLRRGLDQGELTLYFQPQVSIRSGMISGVEALARWQHPQKGILGADQIIPIAEKSGLIVAVGEWILRQACLKAQEWRTAGLAPLRVAVNVSPYQMRSSRLLTAVERALKETLLPPRLLEIEITESVLQDEANSLQTLRELKRMGVSLTIDDFGTGYSCLSSLKTLPIQRLKIDRSFIQDIPQDGNNVAITEAIILMARRLGLSIVAEGVETQAQLEFLRDQGCEEVQGFLYWEPMTAPMMADTLRRNASHRPVGRFAS